MSLAVPLALSSPPGLLTSSQKRRLRAKIRAYFLGVQVERSHSAISITYLQGQLMSSSATIEKLTATSVERPFERVQTENTEADIKDEENCRLVDNFKEAEFDATKTQVDDFKDAKFNDEIDDLENDKKDDSKEVETFERLRPDHALTLMCTLPDGSLDPCKP